MNKARQNTYFFYAILLTSSIAIGYMLRDVLPTIILGGTFAIFTYPLYKTVLGRVGERYRLASLLTAALILIIVVLPLVFIGNTLLKEIVNFRQNILPGINLELDSIQTLIASINELLQKIPGISYQLTTDNLANFIQDLAQPASSFLVGALVNIGASSAAIVLNIVVFVVTVVSIYPNAIILRKKISALSPLPENINEIYFSRIVAMTMSMIKGTFLIALVQTIIGSGLLLITRTDYILTLAILMFVLGVIPYIGTSFVLLPIGAWFLIQGSYINAAILLLGQIIVVGSVDNILRPLLVDKRATLHPALMFFSVLGGVRALGPFGIIYGPVIMIIFITSLQIYRRFYRHQD
ncbi:AI-2E family transporter [candidate division WWE3 bacterium]|uniref:AI-2E family transporter n=1 Tax=candidate division WWE3 bacterium TaxID=2053526 RepID=A0A955LKM4_UNCKA|nr:AI-2E family transporter [candidate division WWE3 bacterium]